jgi:undecaprenyl diphosphate synthase
MKKVPNHIAIIPDGNRRWAEKHRMNPWTGHKHGIARFREISQLIFATGTKYATFWAASIDNLKKRNAVEVRFLLMYLRQEFSRKDTIDFFLKNKVRFYAVGKWRELIPDKKLKDALENLEKITKHFDKYHLTVLFGYDGKVEMLDVIEQFQAEQKSKVSYDKIKDKLWTGFLPDVDYVIRTGGEPHWSAGFMMWLTADSQFYFTETLWPDFSKEKLEEAYNNYSARGRRFGK